MWYNVAQCGTMWYNVAQCGTIWHNVAQCGTMWHNVAQCGTMWHSVAQCGVMWYNMWCKVGTVCGTKSAGRKTAAMTVMVHCYCPTSRCNVVSCLKIFKFYAMSVKTILVDTSCDIKLCKITVLQ